MPQLLLFTVLRSDPTTTSTTQKRKTPPPRRRPILVTQPTTPVRIPITTPRPSTSTTGKATSAPKADAGEEKRVRVADSDGWLPKGPADEGKTEWEEGKK